MWYQTLQLPVAEFYYTIILMYNTYPVYITKSYPITLHTPSLLMQLKLYQYLRNEVEAVVEILENTSY
jgi:hypothetical protein